MWKDNGSHAIYSFAVIVSVKSENSQEHEVNTREFSVWTDSIHKMNLAERENHEKGLTEVASKTHLWNVTNLPRF